MATALISLGSNLGDRKATLDSAVEKLRQTAGISQVVVSPYHATKPVGGPAGQEEFLNAAARLDTSLSPRELLTELQRIERESGRVRQEQWGPRTLDLDLLLYDNLVINEPDLIVPHRFLRFRRFVLQPAVEVAGPFDSLSQWLAHLDTENVFTASCLSPVLRHSMAAEVARDLGYELLSDYCIFERVGTQLYQGTVEFCQRSNGQIIPHRREAGYFLERWKLDEAIDQELGLALPGRHAAGFQKKFEASLTCKAVFFLDQDPSWFANHDPMLGALGTDTLMEALQSQHSLRDRYVGMPTLLLPADDLDRAVLEAVAAIQSMQ